MRTVRLLSVFTLVMLSQPLKAFDVAALGVVGVAMPSYTIGASTTVTTVPKLGFGFGAIAGVYSPFPGFTIETGILMTPHKFTLDSTTTSPGTYLATDTLTMNFLTVPILLRFDLLPVLSFGAGGYLGFASGTITRTTGSTDSPESYDQNNLNKSDFGLMASASVGLPVFPMVKILFDLRYLHGLANLSKLTDKSTATMKDLQLWAGLKLAI